MIAALKTRLAELNHHANQVKADGAIAPANVWIDAYSVKGVSYARARSDQAIFDGGKKLMALGRVGSDRHKEYKLRIQRRDALADIERRSRLIQELIDAELTQPIWEPEPKDNEDSASKTVSKSRTRAQRQTVRTEGFKPGDCVKLPSGHRAYVEKILDNGRAAITWEIGKIEDDFPPHLLELVK